MVFGSVVVASIINYFTLISLVPITALFMHLRVYFLKTSRELKRIEGMGIINLYLSPLSGLPSILKLFFNFKHAVQFLFMLQARLLG